MRYIIRYGCEEIARTRYWYEANILYSDLVERGKRTEPAYPFVCVLVDTKENKEVSRYESPKQLSLDDINRMIKEYGI